MNKIWRKALTGGGPTASASDDLVKLLKLFATDTKPRRKQPYKVWAKSKARPDLEAEVDQRHAVKVQNARPNTEPPPRVSTWNSVASEWFERESEDEKKLACQECDRIHKAALDSWEASASAEPQTPEEAIRCVNRT